MIRVHVSASRVASSLFVLLQACGAPREQVAIELPVVGQAILTINDVAHAIDPAAPEVRPPDLVDWDGAALRLEAAAVELSLLDLAPGPVPAPRGTAVTLVDFLGSGAASFVREVTPEDAGQWRPSSGLASALARLELARDIPCEGSRVLAQTSTIPGASIEALAVTRDGTVIVGGYFDERDPRPPLLGVVTETAMRLRPFLRADGAVRALATDGEIVWAVITPHERLDLRAWVVTLDAGLNLRSERTLDRVADEITQGEQGLVGGIEALPGGRALLYSKARVLALTESSSIALDVSGEYPAGLIALEGPLAITEDSAVHHRDEAGWTRERDALAGARGLAVEGERVLVWSEVEVASRGADGVWTTLPTKAPTVSKLGALPLALDRTLLGGDTGLLAVYDPVSAWCDLMTGRTRWLQGLTRVDAVRFVAFDDFYRNPTTTAAEESEVYWISL